MTIKLISMLFVAMLLTGCKDSTTTDTANSETSTSIESLASEYDFEIISEESSDKLASDIKKTNINIRLKEKLTEQELTALANKIKAQRVTYNNVAIFYYLPDMIVGAGAWATTHFNPDLEVKILGATIEEEKNLLTNIKPVDGELLGNFYEGNSSALYTVYEKKDKVIVRTTFKNGQTMEEVTARTGTTLKPIEQSAHGEYYKLNGDVLEFWNKEDKMFTSAKQIK